MEKLISEAVARQSFFSPVRLEFPLILTKQGDLVEIYEIEDKKDLSKRIQYKEPSCVYDYLWVDAEKYLVLVKDHPIFLRKSCNSKLVCKYPIYSHLYEIRSPYVACIYKKTKILTILGNSIIEFDLETCDKQSFAIKSDSFRPRSVTHAICCDHNLIGLGSYNTSVYLIDRNSGKLASTLTGQKGGITQLFLDSTHLFVGSRKDDNVFLWDLRFPSSPVNCLSFPRQYPTHQRTLFDVNERNDLIVGNFDGSITVYNSSGEVKRTFFAHFDAVNSVQFMNDGCVSSSGQRHYDFDESISLIRVIEMHDKE